MTFFRTLAIEARDAAATPSALTSLRAREIDGVLINHVLDRPTCQAVCAELERGPPGLIKSEFPAKFNAFFYGINLNLAHPDLGAYFAEAPRFRAALAGLHGGALDLEARVSSLLSALDGGRSYSAAPGPRPGTSYMFTTLRAHRPGGYIPAHFDDEQAARPSYRLLTPLIKTKLFSFVLAFSKADSGGALEVFNIHPGKDGSPIVANDRSAAKPDLETAEKVSFRLNAGDMIVFNSGHHLHRVTPVVGANTRWTACSFMSERRDGDGVYCWG